MGMGMGKKFIKFFYSTATKTTEKRLVLAHNK